jgi:type II secretory pathway component PulF
MDGDFLFWILDTLTRLVIVLFSILLSVGWTVGIIFLIHFLLTVPMRRMERARLFLDLLDDALKRGQTAEAMILSAASSRDPVVGVRFHTLAAYIESGLRFGEALEKVPRFLPPQISAMLRAGESLGDLKRVLPACREILRDRPATVRSAVHYMLLVILFFSPVFVWVLMAITIFIVPKFKEVAAGMGVALPALTIFVFANTYWLVAVEIACFALLLAVTVMYLGGPQFARWFQFRGFPLADWIAWNIPWKRKRLQRTFSAMLSVLLDGGVPEAVAMRLAGDCTANEIYRSRARRIIAALEQGVKIDEAVRAFDNNGEFHWRFANAAYARGGFLRALQGWHEALDAKAFQQEEATAHTLTTGVVIMNGLVVALIAVGTYGMLVMLLKNMLASE